MSDGDYGFLHDMEAGERWVWLAGRIESLERRMAAGTQTQEDHSGRIEHIERRCAERAWHGAALKAGVALLVTTLLSSFGTLLFMVLSRVL